MKKLNLILKDASASPEHLVISIIFSLYVMEFVNLFDRNRPCCRLYAEHSGKSGG